MKRRSRAPQKQPRPAPAPSASPGVRIQVSCQVLRDIRKYARSSMNAEICGVLLGTTDDGTTVVDASIQGEDARQGGSHVTFTQDTWTHIYRIKDSQYPDKRIVGWYHSHPGFGVFLSEHDTFIHRNFFSDPSQVAWVYDPQREEEGCFAWEHGEIKRLTSIGLRDAPSEPGGSEDYKPSEFAPEEHADTSAETRGSRVRIVTWVVLALSHAFALVLGLVAGALLAPQVIVIPERPEARPAISSPAPQPSPPAVPKEGRKK